MNKIKVNEIVLAGPRGFCAGVERAVDVLDRALQKYDRPVYVRHQIVHNRTIVKEFEKKGAIFVESISEVPDGSVIVFSAHGSPPEFYEEVKKKNLILHDAMCPLVLKVHLEARRYTKEGYFIFYIGHRGHPEPIGVMGNVPKDSIVLIDSVGDIEKVTLPQTEKLIVLTQTTLSFDDTKEILNALKNKFSSLVLPPAFDICYATQNRQLAVKALAKEVDIIIVLGSPESSNSVRLKEVGNREGIKSYLVDSAVEIQNAWFENVSRVGITAGASAPDHLVQELVALLKGKNTKVRELHSIKENVFFPLPAGL